MKDDAGAVLFFCLGIGARFLDSVLDFRLQGGKAISEYIAWDSQKDMVNSPTVDNPRTWLTFFSLVCSLIFASMAMNDEWDKIKTDNDARNDELGDGMITAVFFIALHILVVLFVLLEGIVDNENIKLLTLSRSRFVRTAVSTVVLSALAVAAGKIGLDSAMVGSNGAASQVLTSLVAYVFADTVGRELL